LRCYGVIQFLAGERFFMLFGASEMKRRRFVHPTNPLDYGN